MTQAAALRQPKTTEEEITINLYCFNELEGTRGIQCAEYPHCGHGPNWAQKELSSAVLSGEYDDILAIGGFRAGKTSEGVRLAVELAIKYPGNRVLITRKYSVDYQSTIAPVIEETIPRALIMKYPTTKEPFYIVRTSGMSYSEIWCMGLYGTDRKRIGKIKGQSFGAIFVDQAEELNIEDHKLLKARLSLKGIPVRVLVYLANPPNIGHWLHDRYEVQKPKRSMYFKMPTSANQLNIPEDYIPKLREDYRDRPGWVQAYLEGTWGYAVIGDPALKGFRDETHIKSIPYDKTKTLYRGWDYGWKHPAVGWYQRAGDGLHKLWEDMGDKILITNYGQHIVTVTNDRFPNATVRDFGDYAGNQKSDKSPLSSAEILHDTYNIKVESKPNPEIDATIDLMQTYISKIGTEGNPLYTVDPKCRITIDGLQGGYCRDENGEIIKDGFFEHIMDTDRYVFWNLFRSESNGRDAAKRVKIRSATYGFGNQKIQRAQGFRVL